MEILCFLIAVIYAASNLYLDIESISTLDCITTFIYWKITILTYWYSINIGFSSVYKIYFATKKWTCRFISTCLCLCRVIYEIIIWNLMNLILKAINYKRKSTTIINSIINLKFRITAGFVVRLRFVRIIILILITLIGLARITCFRTIITIYYSPIVNTGTAATTYSISSSNIFSILIFRATADSPQLRIYWHCIRTAVYLAAFHIFNQHHFRHKNKHKK